MTKNIANRHRAYLFGLHSHSSSEKIEVARFILPGVQKTSSSIGFDFELSQPRITGLLSECSPNCANWPRLTHKISIKVTIMLSKSLTRGTESFLYNFLSQKKKPFLDVLLACFFAYDEIRMKSVTHNRVSGIEYRFLG